VASLDALRQEAPPEVWEAFPSLVANAAGELARFQGELASIRAIPRQDLGGMNQVDRALKRWGSGLADLRDRLSTVGPKLDTVRYCREHSQSMLNELRESLAGPDTD